MFDEKKLDELLKNIRKAEKDIPKPKPGLVAIDVFFGILLGFGLLIPIYMLAGIVIADLWLWFVVPLGLAAISKAHAVGLMILLFFLTNFGKEGYHKDKDVKSLTGRVLALNLSLALGALLVWGVGALIVTYIGI